MANKHVVVNDGPGRYSCYLNFADPHATLIKRDYLVGEEWKALLAEFLADHGVKESDIIDWESYKVLRSQQ